MSFGFSTLPDLVSFCREKGYGIKFSEELDTLATPFMAGEHKVPNRFCVHPMEGSDALADGRASAATYERYRHFARGGSGLIWFEAVSVVPQGRASPNQLMVHKDNMQEFSKIIKMIKREAIDANGYAPVVIMQLTHSGRFSKPFGVPQPIIAYHKEVIDQRHSISSDYPIVTDCYLEGLPEHFANSALLAKESGFDGIDVKCCHRYLLSELLSAFERPGKYGGSFENRTRLLLECVDAVRSAVGDELLIGTRLNGFDALPGGFGCDKEDFMKPELSETLKLVKLLKTHGIDIFNITTGSPYYNSFVNRPNDVEKQEPPLSSVARMFDVVGEVQQALQDTPVVGTGFSYLREFIPFAAAGEILAGKCTSVGLGRMSFACPNYPADVLQNRLPSSKELCTTCGQCAQLLRAGGPAYCAVFDKKL